MKKTPDRNIIKKRVFLVLKKSSQGMKLRCTCQASHGEAVASVEEDIAVNEPPRQGKCKLKATHAKKVQKGIHACSL